MYFFLYKAQLFFKLNFLQELRKERAESARRSATETEHNPFRLDLSEVTMTGEELGEQQQQEDSTEEQHSPSTTSKISVIGRSERAHVDADEDGYPLECIEDMGKENGVSGEVYTNFISN